MGCLTRHHDSTLTKFEGFCTSSALIYSVIRFAKTNVYANASSAKKLLFELFFDYFFHLVVLLN